jgi:chromosome partitioning protein
MSVEPETQRLPARVIVVGNEKGGSGKSTVAMHVAIALMRAGQRVATIDLDSRQSTFTHYIENRHAWAQHIARDLEIPNHLYFTEHTEHPTAEDEAADGKAFIDIVDARVQSSSVVVIDTPGHNSHLGRLAHSIADILITPLNDSFVDLDVLGTVNPETLGVTGTSHYSQMVQEARQQRHLRDNVTADWIVLRNRLSMLGSRNTRCVGEGLQKLSQMLNFRCVDGLAERVIFREFYPRGLTALDAADEIILGTRPTMSHVTARLEIENLLAALGLGALPANGKTAGDSRAAA